MRVRDGKVTIRPIAGTRRRGATPAEDEALAADLLADPKERAEHLMLLDLGRNDVGRVAEIGTVNGDRAVRHRALQPRDAHRLERRGQARPAPRCVDALAAGFPAGTVSGAPKVRAMEIIDELESDKRGLYGGCDRLFRRLRRDGHLHCATHRRSSRTARCMCRPAPASSTIPDPDAEHRECMNKAKGLFRAAEEAVRFATRAKRGQ